MLNGSLEMQNTGTVNSVLNTRLDQHTASMTLSKDGTFACEQNQDLGYFILCFMKIGVNTKCTIKWSDSLLHPSRMTPQEREHLSFILAQTNQRSLLNKYVPQAQMHCGIPRPGDGHFALSFFLFESLLISSWSK